MAVCISFPLLQLMKDFDIFITIHIIYNHIVTLDICRSCWVWRCPYCSPTFLPRHKEASIGRRMFLAVPFSFPSISFSFSFFLYISWVYACHVTVRKCKNTSTLLLRNHFDRMSIACTVNSNFSELGKKCLFSAYSPFCFSKTLFEHWLSCSKARLLILATLCKLKFMLSSQNFIIMN